MRLASTLTICALVLAGASQVRAADEPKYGSIPYFYNACKSALDSKDDKELFKQGECSGMLQALNVISEQLGGDFKFCSPVLPSEKLIRVALDYFDKHPDIRNGALVDNAIQAFRAEWPCKK